MVRYFGSAATAPPADEEVFELAAAPIGGWPNLGGMPLSYNGYTYVGGPNNAGGIFVTVFNESTGAKTTSTIATTGSTSNDQHNKPALIRVASDDRLLTVFCDHASANIWVRETVNTLTADPTISGGWGTATNIDSQVGGIAYTYPALFQMTGETNDPILLLFRTQDGSGNNWCISRHLDDGSSWATGWTTLENITFGTRYYMLACATGGSRVDFAVTDGSYAEDVAKVYHGYYEAGDYHTSDGAPLVGSPPYDITDFTEVYDGADGGARVPYSIVNDGTTIAIAYVVQTGTPSGHIGEDGDYLLSTATVGSATWTTETVAEDVGAKTFDYTEGGCVLVWDDINRMFVSKRPTSDVGVPWRMYLYTRDSIGDPWTIEIIDSSGDSAMYPLVPLGYVPECQVVYPKGTFVTQSDFDNATMGWGVPT